MIEQFSSFSSLSLSLSLRFLKMKLIITLLNNRLHTSEQRIVNYQFFQLQAMNEAIRPDFIAFCNMALYQIKNELSYLRRKLETLVQATIEVTSFGAVGWWSSTMKVFEVAMKAAWVYNTLSCLGQLGCGQMRREMDSLQSNSDCSYRKHLVGGSSKILDRFHFMHGVVNARFNEIVCVNNTGERDCVVQRIETYFVDVDTILAELSLDVDNSEVDFCKFASLAREIEDKSASIGAEHVRLACSDLIKAGDEMNKRMFFRSVLWVQHEFTSTKKKLDAFVQMERRIIRLERSKSSN